MKRILLAIMLLTLLLLNLTLVFAENTNQKIALVEKANSQKALLSPEAELSEEEKLEIIKLISTGEKTYTEDKLNSMGIYTLETDQGDAIFDSGPSDVSLSTISCYYLSVENEWVLSGAGQWLNDNWFDDQPMDPRYGKHERNVGDSEYLGISLYDTNTAPYYLDLKESSYAWIEDKLGLVETCQAKSLSNLHTKWGVLYGFQDSISYKRTLFGSIKNLDYRVYKFGVIAVYNELFTNYTGKAHMFYGHTGDTGVITKNSLGQEPNLTMTGVKYEATGNYFVKYSPVEFNY